MTHLQTLEPPAPTRAAPSAVVWINGRQAIVATMSYDRRITTFEITRGWFPEASYLAQVVRAIGDRERVVILGPTSVRLAVEREYVSTYRRPGRLVDVEPSGPVSAEALVDRLRDLSA